MPTILVRDLMRVGVPTCPEQAPLAEVARLLVERNAGALVVLDKDGNAVGWVGDHHVARAMERSYMELTAADIMDEHVPTVQPDLPAAAVAQLMLDRGLRQFFVTHHTGGAVYPAAVFTLQDVVRLVAGMERAPGVGVGAERPSAIDLFKHRYGIT